MVYTCLEQPHSPGWCTQPRGLQYEHQLLGWKKPQKPTLLIHPPNCTDEDMGVKWTDTHGTLCRCQALVKCCPHVTPVVLCTHLGGGASITPTLQTGRVRPRGVKWLTQGTREDAPAAPGTGAPAAGLEANLNHRPQHESWVEPMLRLGL